MRVQRGGTRLGQPFAETLGDLPGLEGHATQFIQPMQQPWTSAHRWLWARDVGCEEDTARPGDNAPVIWAILTGFLSPRVRPLACRTRPQGVRARTHQLEKVDALLAQGFHPPQ